MCRSYDSWTIVAHNQGQYEPKKVLLNGDQIEVPKELSSTSPEADSILRTYGNF
jgi:hypothetical protein